MITGHDDDGSEFGRSGARLDVCDGDKTVMVDVGLNRTVTCTPDTRFLPVDAPAAPYNTHITITHQSNNFSHKARDHQSISHSVSGSRTNMDHPQTPRILAPHLSAFQHRIVRIVGKVIQLRGETAIIDAGGHIDVILNRVLIIPPTQKLVSFQFNWADLYASRLTRPIGLPPHRRPRRRSDWQSGPKFACQGTGEFRLGDGRW